MFKVESKNHLPHENKTKVHLSKESGNYIYTIVDLIGDQTSLSDDTIVENALEVLNAELNPTGAIQKLKANLEQVLQDMTNQKNELKEFTDTAKQEFETIKQTSAVAQGAIMELYEQFMTLVSGVAEAEDPTPENTEEVPVDVETSSEPTKGGE